MNYTGLKPSCLMFRRTLTTIRKSPQLYAHPHDAGRLLISLSKNPTAVAMGTLPENRLEEFTKVAANRVSEDFDMEVNLASPSDFKENKAFMPLLNNVLTEHVQDCPNLQVMIPPNFELDEYFYAVSDLRAPPAYGRIPETQDTLGHVTIRRGKMIPHTFQPNGMYRLCTGDGILTLSEYLTDKVLAKCEAKEGRS